MTRAEELLRSTTRAIASSVHDVPPLRLESATDELPSSGRRLPRHHGPGRPGRWLPWLAPVASVVVVMAVAIALVIVKDVQNGPPTPRATQATPATANGVPEYYVAWMQADQPYLVVGDTVTGAIVATVMSPSGVYLDSVYGTAADDRTFIVTGDRPRDASAGTQWYLLRITPGSRTAARLTPLPIPVRQAPAGVAISPDGTKLAVAVGGTSAVLRIYSVATGALQRSWSAPTGQITAVKSQPGSWQFNAMVLRWSADGSELAFTWNAAAIRGLYATTPNGNLLASSTMLAAIGTTHTPAGTAVTCNATQGWDLFVGAKGWAVGCAATWQAAATPSSSGPSPAGTGKCASGHPVTFGIDVQSPYGSDGTGNTQVLQLALAAECSGQVQPEDGAYIGWANADASILIGSVLRNGRSQFGIFRGDHFTPLPALPISVPIPTGRLIGTDAW